MRVRAKRNRSRTSAAHMPAAAAEVASYISHRAAVRQILRGPGLQLKLAVGQANDKFEREAEHVADAVMRMPQPTEYESPIVQRLRTRQMPQRLGTECEQEQDRVQRQTIKETGKGRQLKPRSQGEAAPVTSEVESQVRALRGSGRPLSEPSREFFEVRLGRDLSQVRVHTDGRSADSAAALEARAYTIGSDIVFGAGEYHSETSTGQRLIAHELVHVVQQQRHTANSPPNTRPDIEPPTNARDDGIIQRTVSTTGLNCPAGVNGAPADPLAALTAADDFARQAASAMSLLLLLEAILPWPSSATYVAYQARFGLPPAWGTGFLNRLTGATEPTLNDALVSEFSLLSRRYALISQLFSGAIDYQCVSGPTPSSPLAIPNCSALAWSAHALFNYIALCPGFWTANPTAGQRGLILIHEATHMIWGTGHGGTTGPGRSFTDARCYTQFVADVLSVPLPAFPGGGGPSACVAPP